MDLPNRAGVLTARELEITGLNAWELLPRIADRKFSAVEVCRAFCGRAVGGHLVVCIPFFKTLDVFGEGGNQN